MYWPHVSSTSATRFMPRPRSAMIVRPERRGLHGRGTTVMKPNAVDWSIKSSGIRFPRGQMASWWMYYPHGSARPNEGFSSRTDNLRMSPYRNLPPLNALAAFEAVARLRSFAEGATDLCVTQSAISHRIKFLEAFYREQLFFRRG